MIEFANIPSSSFHTPLTYRTPYSCRDFPRSISFRCEGLKGYYWTPGRGSSHLSWFIFQGLWPRAGICNYLGAGLKALGTKSLSACCSNSNVMIDPGVQVRETGYAPSLVSLPNLLLTIADVSTSASGAYTLTISSQPQSSSYPENLEWSRSTDPPLKTHNPEIFQTNATFKQASNLPTHLTHKTS